MGLLCVLGVLHKLRQAGLVQYPLDGPVVHSTKTSATSSSSRNRPTNRPDRHPFAIPSRPRPAPRPPGYTNRHATPLRSAALQLAGHRLARRPRLPQHGQNDSIVDRCLPQLRRRRGPLGVPRRPHQNGHAAERPSQQRRRGRLRRRS
ncbi:hypothetical protein DFJ73DRAFT_852673 [Zopfochytrium polystomum]|nr:hypothetical protein DFJ73DRAFT_852673 [Zopfochytrium polystomum]